MKYKRNTRSDRKPKFNSIVKTLNYSIQINLLSNTEYFGVDATVLFILLSRLQTDFGGGKHLNQSCISLLKLSINKQKYINQYSRKQASEQVSKHHGPSLLEQDLVQRTRRPCPYVTTYDI